MNDEYKVHEETRHGFKIVIRQDVYHEESPDDWGDENLFLVGFHGDFTVERKGFDEEVVRRCLNKDKVSYCCGWILDRDDNTCGCCGEKARGVLPPELKEYHVFGLEAYIHSGVALALVNEGDFPDRQWDVSYVGAVFVAKKEWKTRAKARKAALNLIKEWNDCLSGNIWGYTVYDENDEVIDGCAGFYGDWEAKGGILDEARNSADHYHEKLHNGKTQLSFSF